MSTTIHKFSRALTPFRRNDTATVDCGNGWMVEIKQFQSVMPELRKAQAAHRAAGGNKTTPSKARAQSVVLAMDPMQELIQSTKEEDKTFLGTKQADMHFFAEHFISGWTGLVNDEGKEVPYSVDIAYMLLSQTGSEGEQLYNELLMCSMDTKLFVVQPAQMAEEDAGNL